MVTNSTGFRNACESVHKLILIPKIEEEINYHTGPYKGHHVLVPLSPDDSFNSEDIIEQVSFI